jgi:hypothetical protein
MLRGAVIPRVSRNKCSDSHKGSEHKGTHLEVLSNR